MSQPSTPTDQIESLRRDLNRLKIYAVAATVVIGSLGVMAATRSPANETLETLNVQRINVVEPDGTLRLALTNDALTPGPIIDGREGRRNFPFSGLLFYDAEGDEIGGHGSGQTPNGVVMMSLMDYRYGEAGGAYRLSGADSSQSAAFFINDAPPADADSAEAVSVDRSRIRLHNANRDAEIVLNDTQARPRIRLRVDRNDQPKIEILDPSGAVVATLPEG